MMIFRKSISYILCLCLCTSLAAQKTNIDSLERRLASGSLGIPEKANLLTQIAGAYRLVDTAKCRTYAMEALEMAKSAGLKKVEAKAYNRLGEYSQQVFDTAMMRTYSMKTFMLAKNNKGLEVEEASAHLNMGNYYMFTEQFYLCHASYKKAEKLYLQHNCKPELQTIYHNLVGVFYLIEDNENMKYYADKLLEIATELNDADKMFSARLFAGIARYKNDTSQEAIDFFMEMYNEAKLLNHKNLYMTANYCARMNMRLNRVSESLPYLHSVRRIREVTRQANVSETYALLAESYALLPRLDSAEYYLNKAQNASHASDWIRKQIYRSRSLVEALKGDYKNALETYKKFHHLSDSIAKSQKTTEIARMKNWRELEQKDKENEILQFEQQKQQKLIRMLTGTLVIIIVLLTLSVILYRKTAEKNRELKQLHTVKDKLFSVVAHDLRSPMGALMSMLNLANNEMLDAETQAQLLKDISARVDDTYGLLDNLLHWSRSQMQGMTPAPVYFDAQEGSRAVTDSLQSIAAHKNIALNNRIEKQQVYADRDMFAVVVRNLTMNAIKYTPEVGEITLTSELKDNMLIISVKDNGTGMTKEVQEKLFKLSETRSKRGTNNESGTGLGLVLCADFVKINGGSIWFTSVQGEGSTFYFSVPVKEN